MPEIVVKASEIAMLLRRALVGQHNFRALLSTKAGGLSASEARQYEEEGYVIPHYTVDPQKIKNLRLVLDRLIEDNPGIPPEQLVSVHIEGTNREGVVGSSAFLDLAKDEAILDLVESVIGHDIILWGCQAFCKPAGTGMEVRRKTRRAVASFFFFFLPYKAAYSSHSIAH